MTSDMTAPATKQDIGMLMEEIGNLYDANERWKSEILDGIDSRVERVIKRREKIFVREIDTHFENRIRELQGSWKDQFAGHEMRIVVLEQNVLLR